MVKRGEDVSARDTMFALNVTLACEDWEISQGAHKVILTSGYSEVEQILRTQIFSLI